MESGVTTREGESAKCEEGCSPAPALFKGVRARKIVFITDPNPRPIISLEKACFIHDAYFSDIGFVW
jgi:hypothetical protein